MRRVASRVGAVGRASWLSQSHRSWKNMAEQVDSSLSSSQWYRRTGASVVLEGHRDEFRRVVLAVRAALTHALMPVLRILSLIRAGRRGGALRVVAVRRPSALLSRDARGLTRTGSLREKQVLCSSAENMYNVHCRAKTHTPCRRVSRFGLRLRASAACGAYSMYSYTRCQFDEEFKEKTLQESSLDAPAVASAARSASGGTLASARRRSSCGRRRASSGRMRSSVRRSSTRRSTTEPEPETVPDSVGESN